MLPDDFEMSRRELMRWAGPVGLAPPRRPWPADLAAQAFGRQGRVPDRAVGAAARLRDAGRAARQLHHAGRRVLRAQPHAGAAQLDEAAWKLAVDGEGGVAALALGGRAERLPSASVTVTLECAGNGRAFFEPPVAGIQWRKGAVGTASGPGCGWPTCSKRGGAKPAATHVCAAAPTAARHAAGVRAPGADGEGARPRHDRGVRHERPADSPGSRLPLRLVVPGWEGAYAIKWLNTLTVASEEHDGFWVQTGYRYPTKRVAPGPPWTRRTWRRSRAWS